MGWQHEQHSGQQISQHRDVFGAGTAHLYSLRCQHRFGKQEDTKYGSRMVASQSVTRVFFLSVRRHGLVFIGLCVSSVSSVCL